MSKMLSTKVRDAAVFMAAQTFRVRPGEILGTGRTKRVAYARHYAMWLLRELGYSLPEIGRQLDKHHTSVLFAISAHEQRVKAGDLTGFSIHRSNLSVDGEERTENGVFNVNAKQETIAA